MRETRRQVLHVCCRAESSPSLIMYMTDSDVIIRNTSHHCYIRQLATRLRRRRETSGLPGNKLYALIAFRPHAMKS